MQKIQALLIGMGILTLTACGTVGTSNKDNLALDKDKAKVYSSGLGADKGFINRSDTKSMHALQVGDQTYYFDFDSADVRAEDRNSINVQARYLATHVDAKLVLEGYTDPRGSREYNIGLGERRADSVAEALKVLGVKPGQIRTLSYGAEKLASNGHTEEDYALDRRVNLIYEAR